jgi:hypothetical protein
MNSGEEEIRGASERGRRLSETDDARRMRFQADTGEAMPREFVESRDVVGAENRREREYPTLPIRLL